MKTHFLHHGTLQACNGKPLAKGSRVAAGTTDKAKVTCGSCKRIIGA